MEVASCEIGCTPLNGWCDSDLDHYCPCAACAPERTKGYMDNCGNISCKVPSACDGGGGGDSCTDTCPCTPDEPTEPGEWIEGTPPAGHPEECLITEICAGTESDCSACPSEQDYYLERDSFECRKRVNDPPEDPETTGGVSGPLAGDPSGVSTCDNNNPYTFTVTYSDATTDLNGWEEITKIGFWVGTDAPESGEAIICERDETEAHPKSCTDFFGCIVKLDIPMN